MSLSDRIKTALDRPTLRPFLASFATAASRRQGRGVRRIFPEDDLWIHETAHGYFVYPHPYIRLDLPALDAFTRSVFLRAYQPRSGHFILDIGAGTGEETLTFSRAVGPTGRVVCVEAHPRTFRCLEKLVQYNQLANVIPVHCAVSEPRRYRATIEDSARYQLNRSHLIGGITVPAATIDDLTHNLGLSVIHFLKMNIEGAERLAIRGMTATLRRTRVVCICCHDFLASSSRDATLRTKHQVVEFLQQAGFTIGNHASPHPAPYLADQVWATAPHHEEAAAG